MKKLTKILGVFLLTFFSVATIQAQDVSVDEILKNYYENIGGAENWKKVKNMKISGTASVQGGQFTFDMVRYSMPPNLVKMEMDIMGKQMVQAYDGETAWMINPLAGGPEPQKITGDEAEELTKQNFEDDLIEYASKGHKLEMEGTEEVDGAETYKLKLTKKDGDIIFYFFDTENFVPIVMRSFVSAGPMKGEIVNTYLSEYDEVEDGLIIAYSMEQKVGGNTVMAFTTKKVEFNVEGLEKSTFAFPETKEEDKKE